MNLDDLKSAVAETSSLSKADVGRAVIAVFDAIKDGLANGEKISLIGFGSFVVVDRNARTGRNPQTGEAISIPASRQPKFKPGQGLKDAVNG